MKLEATPAAGQGRTYRSGMAALWIAALLAAVAPAAQAQMNWGEEYARRLKATQAIAPLADGAFGDQVNLYNGTVSFTATDIALPGNSALPVALSRTYDTQEIASPSLIGDWDIDIPHLSAIHSTNAVGGWAPLQRCSTVAPPPAQSNGSIMFETEMFWSGTRLRAASGGGDLLAINSSPKLVRPTWSGYRWTNKDGWFFTCLPALKNGQGEGFVGHAPDGTKYYFDWLVLRNYGSIMHPHWTEPLPGSSVMHRHSARIFATRIEDRFGNWVEYDWNGDVPTRIHSNDGRSISLTYQTYGAGQRRLATATAAGRTWTYAYSGIALVSVTNPDASRWEYALDSGRLDVISYQQNPFHQLIRDDEIDCSVSHRLGTYTRVYSVTHPAGSRADFTFAPMRHGRKNVEYFCNGNAQDDPHSFRNYTASYHDVHSLVSKRITGPGLQAATYTYGYTSLAQGYVPRSPAVPANWNDLNGATPPPNYKYVTVTDPEGTERVHTFGKDYGLNEGQLFNVQVRKAGTTFRTISNVYVSQSELGSMPFPGGRGSNLVVGGDPLIDRPIKSTTTTQQGIVFTRAVNQFDAHARPVSVTRSSTLTGNPSRTDLTQYHDDLDKWVLGQPSRLTVDGVVASEATYNAASALPTLFREFGRTVQTLTYNADGTVATVRDGRNNTTTLTNWKRGIPQTIRFPATPEAANGATRSAVVNDHGWITRVTDENGFATNYAYDPMGRLSQITYPTGDSVAWNATLLSLERATASAYGLPAGHWRHTVATGNGRKVTYLDALWRPQLVREYDTGNATATQRFTRQSFDREGRVVFASYPSAGATPTTGSWTEYDALGRATSVTQDSEHGPLTTLTQYLSGFQTRVTSPKGAQTHYRYLAWDQPATDHLERIVHPEGAYTYFGRDAFGKPTYIRRRNADNSVGVTRSYVYDQHQQLCKTVEPETGATIMAYDAAGNLAWSKAGATQTATTGCNTADIPVAQRTVRSYDARNRVQALTFPDGLGNTTYSYEPDGNLAQVVVDNGGAGLVTTVYSYNRRRMLEGEAMGVGGVAWGLGYGYNANGHLASHVYPDQVAVTYAPNALGQPTRAGAYATAASYFPNGALKQFTYGNGAVHTLTQNARGLPERSRDVRSGTTLHDDSLDYDAHGNVAAISDGLAGGRGNRTMSYDGLDRLTGTTSPMFGTATYGYDVLDNLRRVRLSAGPRQRDHTYAYDAKQRLTQVTNTSGGATVMSLGYDVQGNLASRNGQGYAFDQGNRLREVAGLERYRYDGHGRRVQAFHDARDNLYSIYGQDGVLRYQADYRTRQTR
ncbi:RHS repeat protein, partial [Luteimonas sp. SJ-92]